MNPLQKTARQAGWLYLLAAVTAPPGLVYVPGRIFVRGDMAATADHLRASAALLRVGIGSELFSHTLFIFVVLALYRLFRAVSEPLAKLMAALMLVSLPIVYVNVLTEVAAAFLVSGDYSAAFDRAQLDGLAYLLLRVHGRGFAVAEIFWGLWLFPFAGLILRSTFIPRVLGYLLVLAGCGYLLDACLALFVPTPSPAISLVASILMVWELPIILWLAIWGVKTSGSASIPPANHI